MEEFLLNSKILSHKVIHSIKSIFKKYRTENTSSQILPKENLNKSDARPITQDGKSNIKTSIPQISDSSYNNKNNNNTKKQESKDGKETQDNLNQIKDIKKQKYLNPPVKTTMNNNFSSGITNQINVLENQNEANPILEHNREQNSNS